MYFYSRDLYVWSISDASIIIEVYPPPSKYYYLQGQPSKLKPYWGPLRPYSGNLRFLPIISLIDTLEFWVWSCIDVTRCSSLEFLAPAPNSCKAHSRDIILRKYHGMLASYNYPFPYDEYGPTKCSWRFKTHPGYKIKLSFDRFDLPDSKDCSDDYVEVNRQRFCGSKKPSTVTLHDDRLTFRSSGKKRFSGFKATYTAESEYPLRCHGNYSIPSPIVLSLRHVTDWSHLFHYYIRTVWEYVALLLMCPWPFAQQELIFLKGLTKILVHIA